MKRRFAHDDSFDFSDATEAYGDAIDAYEGALDFDIAEADFGGCIHPSGHRVNLKDGPRATDGITPLCVHCYQRIGR